MKKENLVLLAEGHKLIAMAYAREAGVEFETTVNTTEQAPVETTTEAPTEAKKPTIRPKAPTQEEAPKEPAILMDEEDDNAEDGYTLDELNAMTVKQLKELASENGITIPKDTKKADIIDMIMEGAEEADEDNEPVEEEVVAEADEDTQEDAEEADEDVQADEDGEELTIALIASMELAELKELADEYEIDLAKDVTVEDAVNEIVNTLFEEDEIEAYQAQFEDEETPAEEDDNTEESGDDDYLTEADLAEMSLSELKELAKEYEIEHPKVIKADKLRAIIIEALFTEEDREDGEDDDSDETVLDNEDLAIEYGLTEMTVEELQELLTDHKIKARGNKQALIAKVLEAIEEGVIEVEDDETGE